MRDTTCPVCGSKVECYETIRKGNAIALACECKGCGLRFSITTGYNAYQLAERLVQQSGGQYGNKTS